MARYLDLLNNLPQGMLWPYGTETFFKIQPAPRVKIIKFEGKTIRDNPREQLIHVTKIQDEMVVYKKTLVALFENRTTTLPPHGASVENGLKILG